MMRGFWLVMAGVILIAAACGGGDKARESAGTSDAPTSGDELVSIGAVLRESADRTNEIETMAGGFSMDMGMGDESFTMGGTMLMAYPNSMYMEMEFLEQEFAVLMELPDMYVRFGDEWARLDLADAGIDVESFRSYMENHGIVDMDQIAEQLEDAEQLPDEEIDGKTYSHYRGSFDYADLLDDPATQQLLTGPARELAEDAEGSVVVDTWLDAETMLPRRIIMDMDVDMAALGGAMEMTMTMDFLEFNGEVNIPEVPADARDLSEILQETT